MQENRKVCKSTLSRVDYVTLDEQRSEYAQRVDGFNDVVDEARNRRDTPNAAWWRVVVLLKPEILISHQCRKIRVFQKARDATLQCLFRVLDSFLTACRKHLKSDAFRKRSTSS